LSRKVSEKILVIKATLPEAKWPKIKVKIVAIRNGHLGTVPGVK
jgi:hypothetical protein